jgi:NTP pyrophosphatase (non-canonical NTP hydrolase)
VQIKTLKELQAFYAQISKERGFDKETAQDTLLLMMEEVGELARAVRKQKGIKIDDKSKVYPLEEELADILAYLLHMSNILKIDLEEAFWKKEEENKKRVWK